MYVTSDGCFLKDTLSDLTHTNAYTYGGCQAPPLEFDSRPYHWQIGKGRAMVLVLLQSGVHMVFCPPSCASNKTKRIAQ